VFVFLVLYRIRDGPHLLGVSGDFVGNVRQLVRIEKPHRRTALPQLNPVCLGEIVPIDDRRASNQAGELLLGNTVLIHSLL